MSAGLAGWPWPWLILALVAAQRLAELVLARRNARELRAAGAVEYGARHYPLFVLLHGGWLAALFVAVEPHGPVEPAWLAVFAALQAARVWVIASLGRRWTTRVLVVPGAPLVARGPYRWLAHPNYAVVAAEIPALPLALGAWEVAALFTPLNLLLLAHRIRVENRALAAARPDDHTSGGHDPDGRSRTRPL